MSRPFRFCECHLRIIAVLLTLFGTAATARAQGGDSSPARANHESFSKAPQSVPVGYHDWAPLAPELRDTVVSSKGRVLCREMKNAISFAARLWAGSDDETAVEQIRVAWGGDTPCRYVSGLRLSPIEYAVSGDQKSRQVVIVRWADQHGRLHYTGAPAY